MTTPRAAELLASATLIVDSATSIINADYDDDVIDREVDRLMKVLTFDDILMMYGGSDQSYRDEKPLAQKTERENVIEGWAWELLEEFLAEKAGL